MTYSKQLAAFACALTFEQIPDRTIKRAKQLLIDTLGVGLSGSRHPNFISALDGVASIPGSSGRSPVIGSRVRLATPYAALVNGVACHVLDFDDTHTASIVHGSAILTPLSLALGEALCVSGRDMLSAFIAGWEVAARIGIASGNSFHNRGFHSTAIAGVFGATVAAGKLLKLSSAQLTHALGLCGSQAAGITEFLSNNSSSKAYHIGWAAQSAITIAYVSKAGATGPATVFEGRNGLFNTHGLPDRSSVAETVANLGTRWEIERVSIKPYPCCHFAHGAVDCALALRAEGVTADKVQGIHAIVDAVAAGFICNPIESKYSPNNAYGAKFSLPYLVACALIDGRVDQESFTDTGICRKEILTLAHKVTYEEAEPATTGFPNYFPGHLRVTLSDGRVIEKRVAINRGNPDAPLTDIEIIHKFKRNVAGIISQEQARSIVDGILCLERVNDLSEISKQLVA